MVDIFGNKASGSIRWNQYSFLVQDHTTGEIFPGFTNSCRGLLGLPALPAGYSGHDCRIAGRKPIELTLENVLRIQADLVFPSTASSKYGNCSHYSASWESLDILNRRRGAPEFSSRENALFACAMLASYERLNVRLLYSACQKLVDDSMPSLMMGVLPEDMRPSFVVPILYKSAYRILSVGEIIHEGDEFWSLTEDSWIPTASFYFPVKDECAGRYRRIIKAEISVPLESPYVAAMREQYAKLKERQDARFEAECVPMNWRQGFKVSSDALDCMALSVQILTSPF